MLQRWPSRIWIVRHGESAGNVARDAAVDAGLSRIDITERDVDVPLSERGQSQAEALGAWFAAMPESERPNVVLTSPYRRARQTVAGIRQAGGVAAEASDDFVDERLREKELGLLDRLTRTGIEELYPEQAALRAQLGKFYYRPTCGESWCDVILRLRGAMDTISLHHGEKRVLIVAHQVVVLCLRYLLEQMTEAEILGIDAEGDVLNCSVTEYAYRGEAGTTGGVRLERYNFVAPMERAGAPITAEPSPKEDVR